MLGVGGVLLLGAVVALLLQERRSPDASPSQPAPVAQEPPSRPAAAPPSPAAPPIRPAEPAQRTVIPSAPPAPAGSIIARPPGAGDGQPLIRPAPLAQRTVRDHSGESFSEAPRRSFSPEGLSTAITALKAAVAPCAPSAPAVSLGFTLVSANGRAQARNPRVRGANRDPDAQKCVEQALAELSWTTPDGDGEDPVTLALRLR